MYLTGLNDPGLRIRSPSPHLCPARTWPCPPCTFGRIGRSLAFPRALPYLYVRCVRFVSKLFRNVPCFDSLEMSSFPVYCTRARAEDRETLESDLSADAGGYTDGAGPWLCLFFLVSIWQSTMR